MKFIYFSHQEHESLYPIFSGHYACPSNNIFGPNVREHYIVHFVLNGKGKLINQRGTHTVSKGEAFVIRKGEETTYIADTDNPWEYTWIAFLGTRAAVFDNAQDVFKTPAELDMKVLEYVKRGDRSPDIFTSILYELIYHLFDAESHETQDERIREVHRYIKYNYMVNISISELAATFGFERSYFFRMFKHRYGIGPKEYLIKVRLEQAKLLLSRGYSVAECAYMVGYTDAFSFSKAYKKLYGISPSYDNTSQSTNGI